MHFPGQLLLLNNRDFPFSPSLHPFFFLFPAGVCIQPGKQIHCRFDDKPAKIAELEYGGPFLLSTLPPPPFPMDHSESF